MSRFVLATLCLLAGCGEPARPVSPPAASAPPKTRVATSSSAAPTEEPQASASANPSSSASSAPPPNSAAEGSSVLAVLNLPEVQAYCETVVKRGLECLVWESEVPEEKCGPGPAQPLDACNFGVYVGESHKTHSSRFATFFVRPGAWAVVGADDFACGGMSIAAYKKLRAARLKAKPDEAVDCPGD